MARPGKRTGFSRGHLALLATVAIWSLPSLFQFYLLRYYDVWAQNFYRYGVACLVVLPFALFRRRGSWLDLRAFRLCLLPAIPNVIHQISQTVALKFVGPGVYAIFARSSVITTAMLALIFLPEERFVLRQRQFQIGTLLGLVGATGVFLFQADGAGRHFTWEGITVASLAILCWGFYAVLIKKPSKELGPVRSFGVISLLTSLLLLPLACAFGNVKTPLQVSVSVNFILILSAVTCIAVAHVLYYVAIQELGAALAQSLQLLCPLGAMALSSVIFHEHLTAAQVTSAVVLLAGAFLAMRVKPPVPEAAESI